MSSRRSVLRGTGAGLAAAIFGRGSFAQTPAQAQASTRQIRIVVPLAPGSGTDTSARHVARHLQDLSGQAVWVDNKPGGNGFIAVQQLLSAPADGTTLLMGSSSIYTINPALFRKLPYDPVGDFTPLAMVLRAPLVLVVQGNSPWRDLPALLAAARANPGKLNYGAGTPGYRLMSELFCEQAKVSITHVPYKSSVEALAAVAGGVLDMAFIDITGVLEMAKGGRVLPLAIAADKRSPAAPDIPTASERGVPGYVASFWSAAVVSSKTPKAEADRLSRLIQQVVALPDTFETFSRIGAEHMTGGPAEFRAFQSLEIPQWKRVASTIGLEPQ